MKRKSNTCVAFKNIYEVGFQDLINLFCMHSNIPFISRLHYQVLWKYLHKNCACLDMVQLPVLHYIQFPYHDIVFTYLAIVFEVQVFGLNKNINSGRPKIDLQKDFLSFMILLIEYGLLSCWTPFIEFKEKFLIMHRIRDHAYRPSIYYVSKGLGGWVQKIAGCG